MTPPLRGLLFTDLDGTLLDFTTYQPSAGARAALSKLARAGVLTVPVSSKTAVEVLPLCHELDLPGLAVVEGGPVVIAEDGSLAVTGPLRAELVNILGELRSDGWDLRGMSEMSVEEMVELTGLSPEGAQRAMTRLASEPFLVTIGGPSRTEPDLRRQARSRGAGVVRGGRFWHLLGDGIDKATGVKAVVQTMALGRPLPTAAVGDAWNDLSMLAWAELGFILGSSVEDADLPAGIRRVKSAGPDGFAEVADRVLDAWCS